MLCNYDYNVIWPEIRGRLRDDAPLEYWPEPLWHWIRQAADFWRSPMPKLEPIRLPVHETNSLSRSSIQLPLAITKMKFNLRKPNEEKEISKDFLKPNWQPTNSHPTSWLALFFPRRASCHGRPSVRHGRSAKQAHPMEGLNNWTCGGSNQKCVNRTTLLRHLMTVHVKQYTLTYFNTISFSRILMLQFFDPLPCVAGSFKLRSSAPQRGFRLQSCSQNNAVPLDSEVWFYMQHGQKATHHNNEHVSMCAKIIVGLT